MSTQKKEPTVVLQMFCAECSKIMTVRDSCMAYCENLGCDEHGVIYEVEVEVRKR